jgi:hypothetical protein
MAAFAAALRSNSLSYQSFKPRAVSAFLRSSPTQNPMAIGSPPLWWLTQNSTVDLILSKDALWDWRRRFLGIGEKSMALKMDRLKMAAGPTATTDRRGGTFVNMVRCNTCRCRALELACLDHVALS